MTGKHAAFAARLAQVCQDDLKIAPGHGRDSELARRLKVSPNAARKWLRGDGYPEMARAVAICDAAGVAVNWLLQGVGPRYLAASDSLVDTVNRALAVMPDAATGEVADFVRYKLGTVTTLKVNEPPAQYAADIGRALTDKRPR